jgi:SAM-dependent methyltransferase
MMREKRFSGSYHSGAFGAEYGFRPKWNRLQSLYVRTFGVVDLPSRLRARLIVPIVDAIHPSDVIDLGCGTGCYSLWLSRRQECCVRSLEIDEQRIQDLQEIASCLGRTNVLPMDGSAEVTLGKIKESTIDVVIAVEILECIPDLDRAIREIARTLKPGGLLVGHAPSLGYLRPSQLHLLDESSVRQRFERAGLTVQEISRTMGGGLYSLCRAYDWLSRDYFILSLLFPPLLVLSRAFQARHRNGKHVFFIARKNG